MKVISNGFELMKKWMLMLLMLTAVGVWGQGKGMTGKEVMQMVKDRPNGDSRYADTEMTLVKKNGRKRVRRMKSWAMDVGKDVKTIMFFTHPGDVKGTGFLAWDYDAADKVDDKWLYLPAMKRTRRISGKSSKTDYFMGSDFTYDDMSARSVEKEVHRLLRVDVVEGKRCWVVESMPKESGELYSKRVSWVRQEGLLPIKVEYYDKLGRLHRRMRMRKVKRIRGFWVAEEMDMENVQTGHKTLLVMSNHRFDLPVKAAFFTVGQLERGL